MQGEVPRVEHTVDVSKLTRRTLPYKPPPREKPAFNSPYKDSRGKALNLKCCHFDLKEMFDERSKDPFNDYKLDAKWDMPFERDQVMHEIIQKRNF